MSDSSSNSGDSDSSNEGFSEEMFEHFDPEVGIMPYQFEPEIEVASDTKDSEDGEDRESDYGDQDRLQNSNW